MKISWVFDVVSPFCYLSLKQLKRLPEGVVAEFVPVLFAGLLNHFGQLGNAEIPEKRRFTYRFVLWRARKMGIPMLLPPSHPFNPLAALRLIIAAGSHHHAVETVFDAIFADGRDVQDPSVIEDLARQLNIADVSNALRNPEVKQRLHANTEQAISQGVFGVPTFVVSKETFWGHDAFDMVLDYLHDPSQFQDIEMQRADHFPEGVVRQRRG